MTVTSPELAAFLVAGYIATVAIEACVLIPGLSQTLKLKDRVAFAVLLTAFTYPFVVIIFPALLHSYGHVATLVVAEIFAPAAEVLRLYRIMYVQAGKKFDIQNAVW